MKGIWASKTVWFNAAVAIGLFLWPSVQVYVSPETAGALVVAGNILIRWLGTTMPVTVMPSKVTR